MKQMMTILSVLLLALPPTLQAQDDFDIFDMRSGLPETRVRALCQMADGRIAIATAGTVTIYDGTRFTVYHLRPEDEYPLTEYHGYRHLTCDTTGMVWLRNDGILHVIDARHQRMVSDIDSLLEARNLTPQQISTWPEDETWRDTEDYAKVKRFISDDISALLRDSYGGLWVGLKERGLLYCNPARKRQFHTSSAPFPYKSQFPFCSSRASQLSTRFAPSATNCTLDGREIPYTYLGTRKGILIIDRKERLVATLDERVGLSTNNVVSLLQDHRGDVWAATANGLTRLHQTGRDSFNIVNYGPLDGIDTGGREFRTCQIHQDTTGLVTVGFAGGSVTFHPDSITAPRYAFHFPQTDCADKVPAPAPTGSGRWMLVLSAGIVGSALTLATIVWIKVRKKGKANNKNADKRKPMEMQTGQTVATDIALCVARESLPSSDEMFLDKLRTLIEQHLSNEDFSVQTLSEMMAMDRTVLYRRMQNLTGTSPSVYIRNIRLSVAKQLLSGTDLPVGDIADKTGFATTKYFSAAFKDAFGMTPNEYRTQATGKSSKEGT